MKRFSSVAPLVAAAIALSSCGRVPVLQSPAPVSSGASSTDIYLYRFGQFPRHSGVFNITNRKGYDNQPSWDGSSRILYTSQSDGQTDIFEINFETATINKVTDTPESEYSAAIMPDGEAISVVRVERDSTQRLWRFSRAVGERAAPAVILPGIKPVGYFAWLDSTRVALYVLGSPNTLQIADVTAGSAEVVTTSVGRSLQRIPGGRRASFVQREGERWVLKAVDPIPGPSGRFNVGTVASMPDSAEYVAWRSATELYTAGGSRIYRLRLPSQTWTVVEDLSAKGIRRISRIALSPDGSRLALVADEPTDEPTGKP